MNQLEIFERNGKLWTDSREVAAMIDKQHFHLVRDIRGYITSMEKAAESKNGFSETASNFVPGDFFLESSYTDSTSRTLPCFLISKKGCEFVANKLTGDKGVIFTATYVNRFNEYEEFIKHGYASANTTFAEYIKAVGLVAGDLRVNDTSKIIMYQKAFKSYDLPTEFLPDYVDARVMFSATALLQKHGDPIKTQEFNKRMHAAGLLEQKTRKSFKGADKKFWSLTESGRQYGENQASPQNIRETQPLYYENTFKELLSILGCLGYLS